MKEIEYESQYGTYKIRIGENAIENWRLIDDSKQNDLWFHVENHPSCHVVLSCESNNNIHKSVINHCAYLCKEGSKLKVNKSVKIIYTEIKNVKKADKIGSVTTKNTKHIKT